MNSLTLAVTSTVPTALLMDNAQINKNKIFKLIAVLVVLAHIKYTFSINNFALLLLYRQLNGRTHIMM